MTRSRILSLCCVLLLVAVPVACQTHVSQIPPSLKPPPADQSTAVNSVTCKMFALGELAEDASYAKWIVETIPNVIQPGSWDQKKGAAENRTLSYHAPAKVLVVYHTPAVHAKVDEFLKDLKKATMAKAKQPSTVDPAMHQAQFVPASCAAPAPTSGYPVAAPLQQPKHLFHFIIRYEGEGIVDSNVVKFATALAAAAKSEASGVFNSAPVAAQMVEPIVGTGMPPSSPAPVYLMHPPTPTTGGVQNPPLPSLTPPKMPPADVEPAPSAPTRAPSSSANGPPNTSK